MHAVRGRLEERPLTLNEAPRAAITRAEDDGLLLDRVSRSPETVTCGRDSCAIHSEEYV